MRPRPALTLLVALAAASTTLLATPAAIAAPSAAAPSTTVDQHVVVLLKHQPAAVKAGTAAATRRAADIAASQAPVVTKAKQLHSTKITGYRVANAFAATVSKAAEAQLAADPDVAAVVPDVTITLASPQSGATAGDASGGPTAAVIPGACSARPQLEPEGLALMHVDSDDAKAVTARSLGYTGAGVKVAYIAEGIDPTNVNFRRNPADPSSTVFSDYKDFSGDGPNAETTGGEAFLDANAIAGQGKHVYDVNGFTAQQYPTACNVRIEGTAPGASVVGLKVFSESNATTLSAFLQAINYAVQTAHVNVLNESFGGNPFPDVAALDVLDRFNDAAVAAGVTVVASSGDAGPANTIGSPATDPKVIAVGASTNYRFYAQSNYAYARDFARTGWLSDNISPLSSSGYSETNGTVNVVAPGDLSWASCTATAEFDDCVSDVGQPSDIEESGGTSESSPLTAGVAALVIQAYAKAHGGDRPSPALVKQILVSSAQDLGAPANEQGAGLVDGLTAVRLAASIRGGTTTSGSTLLKSTDALSATAAPGSTEHWPVTLTNTGSTTESVKVSSRALGSDRNVQTGSVSLSDASSRKLVDFQGDRANYESFRFTVPSGQDRLDLQYAYQGNQSTLNGRVRIVLIDPKGRYALHTLPQGVGNHGEGSVLAPAPGTWTGYVVSKVTSAGGTTGAVPWRVATQRYVATGSVSAHSLTIAPGASRTIVVSETTPRSPGDSASSVVFRTRSGTTTLPVTLRSRIEVRHGGRFAGTLTSGNGRQAPAQTAYYSFVVPRGVRDITADLAVENAGNAVGLYLVTPNGDSVGYGQNSIAGTASRAATAWTDHPVPGVWTLIVSFASPAPGVTVTEPFHGDVRFNAVRVRAKGLPNDPHATLAAGKPVTVPVRITNNGAAPAQFFVDSRLRGLVSMPLANYGTATVALPDSASFGEWLVPTHTAGLSETATGTVPIEFDLSGYAGDPNVTSRASTGRGLCSTSATARYDSPDGQVAPGIWTSLYSECGPFSGPAPAATAQTQATALTQPFDPAVVSSTGDVELQSIDPTAAAAPITIAAGATAIVPVTVTPSGAPGTTVHGSLDIDALVDALPPYGQTSGTELAQIPYSYTIR